MEPALLLELERRLAGDGFQRMALWVLDANAAVRFSERSGAVRIAVKQREIAGVSLPAAARGWPSLESLVVAEPDEWIMSGAGPPVSPP